MTLYLKLIGSIHEFLQCPDRRVGKSVHPICIYPRNCTLLPTGYSGDGGQKRGYSDLNSEFDGRFCPPYDSEAFHEVARNCECSQPRFPAREKD